MWIIICLGFLLVGFGALVGLIGAIQNIMISLAIAPKYIIDENGEKVDNSEISGKMMVFGIICALVGIVLMSIID